MIVQIFVASCLNFYSRTICFYAILLHISTYLSNVSSCLFIWGCLVWKQLHRCTFGCFLPLRHYDISRWLPQRRQLWHIFVLSLLCFHHVPPQWWRHDCDVLLCSRPPLLSRSVKAAREQEDAPLSPWSICWGKSPDGVAQLRLEVQVSTSGAGRWWDQRLDCFSLVSFQMWVRNGEQLFVGVSGNGLLYKPLSMSSLSWTGHRGFLSISYFLRHCYRRKCHLTMVQLLTLTLHNHLLSPGQTMSMPSWFRSALCDHGSGFSFSVRWAGPSLPFPWTQYCHFPGSYIWSFARPQASMTAVTCSASGTNVRNSLGRIRPQFSAFHPGFPLESIVQHLSVT